MIHSSVIILDFKRISEIDSTGAAILLRFEQKMIEKRNFLLFTHLQNNRSVWSFLLILNVA